MKKIVVIFLLITLIGGRYSTIFASYTQEGELIKELETRVEEIFKQRARIWNGYVKGEEESLSTIELQLKEIITQPLLAMDLETFQHLRENPAGYELINNVWIKGCKVERRWSNSLLLHVEVLWELQSYTDLHREQVAYTVEMRKVNNRWLMSDYQLKR